MAKNSRSQRPIPTKRKIPVATGRRLSPRRQSMMQRKKSGFVSRRRRVETESHVISTRGRVMTPLGITEPFARPPSDMPQSKQDYFLSSRAIARMAYDMKRNTLEIVFTTGYGYQFYGVPVSVWNNFRSASSKGRFFMDHIYGEWKGPKGNKVYFPNYTYRRVR